MKFLFSRRGTGLVALGLLACTFWAVPAQASVNTAQCEQQQYSQPFLYAKDSNWYTLVPGQEPGSFNGEGWTLSGGAQIVTTTLSDGTAGQVLDLPSGSKAVGPVICVTSEYPTARAFVRDAKGSEGVFFYVEYEGTNTWNSPKNTGQIHGPGSEWGLATPVRMQPSGTAGWQPMRITLVPGGKTSEFEVYDLYIDPRMV
jgi:hypothetical protein